MTWSNRLRLVAGALVVLLFVTSASYVFTRRQAQAVSVSAHIVAQSYDVGADYPGLVTATFVEAGDQVTQNEPLFTIESLQVARDVETGALAGNRADVSASGTLVVRAAVAGTVRTIDAREGAYTSSGIALARIDSDDSLSAEAVFILAPRDFGRIEENASVDLLLPDRRVVRGTVTHISVETIDGAAHVTATIASNGLVAGESNGLIQAGTPLEARLHLREDGALAGFGDAVDNLMRKVGL